MLKEGAGLNTGTPFAAAFRKQKETIGIPEWKNPHYQSALTGAIWGTAGAWQGKA